MIACTAGPWRVVRAGALGVLVGGLSVLGHGAAQPHDVSVSAVAVVIVTSIVGATALTSRRLSVRGVAGFAVIFQFIAHFVLTRMSAHPGASGGTHDHGHSPLGVPPSPPINRVSLSYPWSVDPAASAVTPGLSPESLALAVDWTMLATHVAAGLLVVLIVLRAEAAIFGFADAFTRTARVLFGRFLTPQPPLPVATVLVAPESVALPTFNAYACPQRRRGPPSYALSP